ncbi:DNA polymerase domain-containing protein, partial [Pseudomonas sp. SIMBA_068]|uniref:DNA polymerase domain-containing protein n=1 Tax=Pseudomonas sp. SIMBA_068 TaxID=3085808 RepID=UPI00397B0AB8
KIIMNAFYGVLGSSGCRFFDPRLASSITLRGHEIMARTQQLIEAQGHQTQGSWLKVQAGATTLVWLEPWWRVLWYQTSTLHSPGAL